MCRAYAQKARRQVARAALIKRKDGAGDCRWGWVSNGRLVGQGWQQSSLQTSAANKELEELFFVLTGASNVGLVHVELDMVAG